MARVDGQGVVQPAEALGHGLVELLGQGAGLRFAQQVRPPDLAHEERIAGEERGRLRPLRRIDQQVRQVLRRVPRLPECPQPQRPNRDLLPVPQRPVRPRQSGQPPGVDLRPGRRGQLRRPGDEVAVDVGLQHRPDPEPARRRERDVVPHVPPKVDHRRVPRRLVGDQVRHLGQARRKEALQDHRVVLPDRPGAAGARHPAQPRPRAGPVSPTRSPPVPHGYRDSGGDDGLSVYRAPARRAIPRWCPARISRGAALPGRSADAAGAGSSGGRSGHARAPSPPPPDAG